MNFEEEMGKLEEIANKLEKDDLTLDESVKFFEDGMKISLNCRKMLDEAEKKITILLEDKEENFIPEE